MELQEIQENVVAKEPISYPISSTQHEIKINNSNDDTNYLNDQYYKLIVKQAKEFEEFGKQMGLDLQNFYKEFLVQQNEISKEEINPFDIEKVFKKCKEQIDSQSQLIKSLKTRIEELETDSLIKTQDIKKLQNEFKVLATPTVTSAAQDDKKYVSLITNENNIN